MDEMAGPVQVSSAKLKKASDLRFIGPLPAEIGDFSGLTIAGQWKNFANIDAPIPDYVFVPEFKDQDNPALWEDVYDPLDSDNVNSQILTAWYARNDLPYLNDLSVSRMQFNFESFFTADFGPEFSFPAHDLPEKAPPLQLVPDLGHGLLKVRLASAPASDCELVWKAPPIIQCADFSPSDPESQFGGLSARNVLGVVGGGNWDAVYSGLTEDREPQLYWRGGYLDPNGRWPDFGQYVKEWWKPVLTQLVTFSGTDTARKAATYGLNIMQHGRYKYQIDFYRADQVGAKNATSGLYTFLGQPVDSWIVENPTRDDSQNGQLRITSTNAVYNITLSQTQDPDPTYIQSTWNFEMIDRHSSDVLTSGTTIITPTAVSSIGSVILEVVENNTVDHVALPEVTGTYVASDTFTHVWAYPLSLSSILEQDTYGTRTTNWPDYYRSQTRAETGGCNPYSVNYDPNGLLTSSSNGPTQELVSYSGAVATGTETFNGARVRTFQTTYSPDLTSATTTLIGSATPGSVPVTMELCSGTDPINPWAPKLERDSGGTLTTYSYSWSGTNFETVTQTGRESTLVSGSVADGMRIVTLVNPQGQLVSRDVYDIPSMAELDFTDATQFQGGTPFPSVFKRPLGTTEQFSYDTEGRVLSHTDCLGKTTAYTLDALGRVTQAVRGAVTWNVAYNPGYLGESGTATSSGAPTETWSEQTSPFGETRISTISGPRNATVSSTETATSLVQQIQNSDTQQTVYDSLDKTSLAETITGNATQPWNISYTFPGSGGWTRTMTHGTDSALTSSTQYDALGRPIQDSEPDPNGSGSPVTTTYAYTDGLLSSTTDPTGATTQYSYQPDGSLQTVARGSRSVSVNRNISSTSEIGWTCTDATGETLWQRTYTPANDATTFIPYSQSAQAVTTSGTINGDIFKLVTSGPLSSGTTSWQDGAPYQYSVQDGAFAENGSATADAFGDVTSTTINPGGNSANAITTSYSSLGIPTSVSGPVSATFSDAFSPTTGWTHTSTQNSHTAVDTVAPDGQFLGFNGYGQPDQNWTPPSFGSNITQTLTTASGVGSAQYTQSLAGTLLQRNFPDGSSESFQYDGNGNPSQWTTPRSNFSLTPDQYGEPTAIGTMATLGYDLAGQLNAITDASGTRSLTYANGQLSTESHTTGVLDGQTVGHTYNSLGQLQTVTLPAYVGATIGISYSYGSNGTLTGVTTAGGATGAWSNFNSVNGRAQSFAIGPLLVTSTFDGLGRITSEASTSSGSIWAYTGRSYDADGHCNGISNTPAGSWAYTYDTNGYLHTAAIGSQTLSYSFDQAGRPASATTDYRPMTRQNAGIVDVLGLVNPAALVTINGTSVAVNGTTGAFSQAYTPSSGWHTYVVTGTLAGAGYAGTAAVAQQVRNVFVPPTSETLAYDADGDLDTSARWTYGWNSLDQLTSIIDASPYSTATAQEIDCTYDVEGRRVKKLVKVGGQTTCWTTTLWDGWRPVLDIDYSANGEETSRRYYTWGPDVSGSLDGAAGIGGLIEILQIQGNVTTRSLPIYDGIGNVVGLVDATTGAGVATYSYGPFGELLSESGPRANSCPFRYQTKLYDSETGYYYFGKRYYDPKTHTWISRDPAREDGGVNLYAYCNDDPVGNFDAIGLAWLDIDTTDANLLKIYLPLNYGGPMNSADVDLYFMPKYGTVANDIAYARGSAGATVQALNGALFYGGATLRTGGGLLEFLGAAGYIWETGGLGGTLGGGVIAANAADNTQAGFRTLTTGQYESAWLENQFTSNLGSSWGTAGYIASQVVIGGIPSLSRAVGPSLAPQWNLANYGFEQGMTSGGWPIGLRYSGPKEITPGEYIHYVRPGAQQTRFTTAWTSGNFGVRIADDFDPATGTLFEGSLLDYNAIDYSNLDSQSLRQFNQKLRQAAADGWLLRNNPNVKRIIWFGTSSLPTAGPAAALTRAVREAGIEYWVIPRP